MKKLHHIQCLIISLVTGVFFSCRECQYSLTQNFKAKVVDIIPYTEKGNKYYHVMMEFNNTNFFKETVCLEDLINCKITKEYLENYKVQYGNVYTGLISIREKGMWRCPPFIVAFDQRLTP